MKMILSYDEHLPKLSVLTIDSCKWPERRHQGQFWKAACCPGQAACTQWCQMAKQSNESMLHFFIFHLKSWTNLSYIEHEYEHILLVIFIYIYIYSVFLIHSWVIFQGAGTDTNILIEILASRTNKQIKELSAAYAESEMRSILL